jgi:hypothetical protein
MPLGYSAPRIQQLRLPPSSCRPTGFPQPLTPALSRSTRHFDRNIIASKQPPGSIVCEQFRIWDVASEHRV